MDARRPMSALYAESSAVLRWLLGAADAKRIEQTLTVATAVVTSELTAAEVGRSLQRLAGSGQIDGEAAERVWATYTHAAAHWSLYAVSDRVLRRVRQPFPREPLRTLDAIHLATALLYSLEIAPPTILSTDALLRENAEALGLAVVPPPR
jgi:predicted nucleic acid-binding protein